MTTFVVILGVINLLVALFSVLSSPRSGADRESASETSTPSVVLFVPCCGAEEGLAENLAALTSQDHPSLRVCFVVESPDDDAVPVIERFKGDLVVAGRARGRGQKVHNLLAAIERAPEVDVWAFADSDGRPDSGWIGRLVKELDRPGVGAASTYRFYVPEPPSFPTLLRSVWNASVLSLLGEHDRNFAWGGGMVIRREVFEGAAVAAAWEGALSDDYALTHAVRNAGLRVAFVPSCLVPSYGSVRFGELLSWVSRQIKITRVYWPALFRLAAANHILYSGFLLLGAWAGGRVGLALWLVVLLLGSISGARRARALPWARKHAWAHATLFPLTSFLTVQGILRALVSRRIEWRGRVYEMRSPSETIIRGG